MIETERLTLRPFALGDVEPLFALTESAQMRRHLGPDPPSRSASFDRLLRMAGGWALFGFSSFAVVERASGDLVGNCGLFPVDRELGPDFDPYPEAGWIIAQDRWGRGYAHEAMTAALAWFDAAHGRRRTVCMIVPNNAASERLAARLGYLPFRDAQIRDEPIRLYARE